MATLPVNGQEGWGSQLNAYLDENFGAVRADLATLVAALTRVAAPGGAAEPAPAYNRRIWQQLAGVWGWR